jgi:hypothetical protein
MLAVMTLLGSGRKRTSRFRAVADGNRADPEPHHLTFLAGGKRYRAPGRPVRAF